MKLVSDERRNRRPRGRAPVVVDQLTKTYPRGIQAVRGVSFEVREGEVCGQLGPNPVFTNRRARPRQPTDGGHHE
jgi:ABC-type uncharacterized transport system ATPase subunit